MLPAAIVHRRLARPTAVVLVLPEVMTHYL